MRMKWKKILAVIAIPAAIAAGAWAYEPPAELIEYHKTIEQGDTLWGVVGKVATDKEDMAKLVWQVTKDNHIEDPANLQPGQVIIIRVKKARELK